MQNSISWRDKLIACVFQILPHHLISRIIFRLTRIESSWVTAAIRWFVTRYKVNMSEASIENINEYPSFNAFFTRELKPGIRPFPEESKTIACPVDGSVSQFGTVSNGDIFQAKGHSFTTQDLLGGDQALARQFNRGSFITLYLSPRDYHRIHMPYSGDLKQMIYIPGRLFSVSPSTTRTVPRLFARNERVVCTFDSDIGLFAMILVGAINVAAIETVWHGLITPPHRRKISRYEYNNKPIHLNRGQEMGRFNMGSTVILLTDRKVDWVNDLQADAAVKMGQALNRLLPD